MVGTFQSDLLDVGVPNKNVHNGEHILIVFVKF